MRVPAIETLAFRGLGRPRQVLVKGRQSEKFLSLSRGAAAPRQGPVV